MQLARTTFLSRERKFTRKFYEVLLTLRIEQELTKQQIFEIYANQIFLGQRSYGFATAAQSYFGKPLSELSIGQMAMLAACPRRRPATTRLPTPSGRASGSSMCCHACARWASSRKSSTSRPATRS